MLPPLFGLFFVFLLFLFFFFVSSYNTMENAIKVWIGLDLDFDSMWLLFIQHLMLPNKLINFSPLPRTTSHEQHRKSTKIKNGLQGYHVYDEDTVYQCSTLWESVAQYLLSLRIAEGLRAPVDFRCWPLVYAIFIIIFIRQCLFFL